MDSKNKEYLVPKVTDRGFNHMPEIKSVYGGHIRVYEASTATEPRIWATIVCPKNLNEPDGEMVEDAVVLLPLEEALHLAEQIQFLAKNHYHLDD